MDYRATSKPANAPKKDHPGDSAALTVEFLYDTSLITAAVFVFALILNCGV